MPLRASVVPGGIFVLFGGPLLAEQPRSDRVPIVKDSLADADVREPFLFPPLEPGSAGYWYPTQALRFVNNAGGVAA